MTYFYCFADGWALVADKALRKASIAKYERRHGALVASRKV